VFADSVPRQEFSYEGHTYEIALRFKRTYLPYSIELIDFTHDRYPGTEIPKNFASDVRIHNPAKNEHRQTKIYMNHPLRYEGLTFFQASFTKDDQASMFQVVRNPGWLIPYISCGLVSIGLILQFGIHLFRFASRKRV
jgi:cytochrome c biogenesis protein ResB